MLLKWHYWKTLVFLAIENMGKNARANGLIETWFSPILSTQYMVYSVLCCIQGLVLRRYSDKAVVESATSAYLLAKSEIKCTVQVSTFMCRFLVA